MVQAILQTLSLVFPHTFARLARYWHLLFDDNSALLDPQNVILATLPFCIYLTQHIAAIRHYHDDGTDGPLPEGRLGPFRVINDCISYWFLVYKAFDLVAALGVVLRAPGFCGKALLAIDLLVEGILVFLAKIMFFVAVGLLVFAALEGFPFMMAVVMSLWEIIQDLWEELLERDEFPADEPFGEE